MIYPIPKSVEYGKEKYKFEKPGTLLDFYKKRDKFGIVFSLSKDFEKEEYELEVSKDRIKVTYSTDEGCFRAMTSLWELCDDGCVCECKVHDKPDMENRGYMLDISRGRMPRLDTILHFVDVLALLKYNEFQLYMDSFCFKYSAFPEYTKDIECLAPDDIEFLDNYCSERFISLVPNQNSFGHMKAWLEKPENAHLALGDGEDNPWTLNPLDPGSIELLDKIYGSLLPHFKSEYVHVGLDEAYGFGEYQTKEECEKRGIENVFIDYLTKINNLVNKKYGKKIQFWDDMIISHPDSFSKFPQNVTAVEWGYGIISTQMMEEKCRILADSGVRFYVCPSNAVWLSLTSRVDVMEFNVRTTGELAKKYGAVGYLLTDWGMNEDGHMQFIAESYYPCALAGQYAWNSGEEQNCENFKNDFRYGAFDFVDRFVFEGKMGEIMYRLGKFYHLEPHKVHGMTMCSFTLTIPMDEVECETFNIKECGDDFYFDNVISYVGAVCRDIEKTKANENLKDEVLCNAEMIMLGAELCKIKTHGCVSKEKKAELLERFDGVIEEYKRLFKLKNFENGIENSVGKLKSRRDELEAYKVI